MKFGTNEDEVTQTAEIAPPEATDQKDAGDQQSEESEEVVITFGDDEPENGDEEPKEPEKDNSNFRNLRKVSRAQEKEIKRLKRELEELNNPSGNQSKQLRPKPTLADSGYDEDKYDADYAKWFEEKKSFEAQKQELHDKEAKEKDLAESLFKGYETRKRELKYADFDEAEDEVIAKLSNEQQNIILYSADKPELLVYALGKNETILDDLSKEKNPIKFAAKLGKLELQMKVKNRKPETTPDKPLKGSGGIARNDKRLAELEAEASRTKDRTKLIQYKRELKNQA